MAIATSIEQSIVSQVEQWDGITTHEKRDGAVEFSFGGDDFGHVDDDGSVDLPLSSKLRATLVEAGRTEPHPVYKRTGWTTFRVEDEDDVAEAVSLLRLAYVYYVLKVSEEEGKAHLADDIDIEAELDAFEADEGVRGAMMNRRD